MVNILDDIDTIMDDEKPLYERISCLHYLAEQDKTLSRIFWYEQTYYLGLNSTISMEFRMYLTVLKSNLLLANTP